MCSSDLGLYYSNGSTWEFMAVPYQATQSEVDTGTNSNKFVTPNTLFNYSKWGNYVPYTGATTNVDLGSYKLTTDALAFSLNPTNSPGQGQIAYNGATGSLAYLLDTTNVACQIGQQLYAYVTNDEAVTITKGQPVYLFSASGNKASVKLAYNT